MTRKKKFLITLLSFIGLGWFLFQPLNKIGHSQMYMEMPAQGQRLTADELNDFLTLWAQIMQGELKGHIRPVSLSSKNNYSPRLTKWLEAQNWSVERFFYDEQRLRELINYVTLESNLKSNIELSKKAGADLSAIIKEQRQKMKNCPYDEQELALVAANLYQINEIFAGRAVMAK